MSTALVKTLGAVGEGGANLEDGRTARAAQLRADRRRELLAVALRVFSERGYHQTRIAFDFSVPGE